MDLTCSITYETKQQLISYVSNTCNYRLSHSHYINCLQILTNPSLDSVYEMSGGVVSVTVSA